MLVLGDGVISKQFEGLTAAGVKEYQDTLVGALLEYEGDPSIIPTRVVATTPYNATHLFMTSMGTRVGMKAITASREGFKGITTVLDRETGAALAVISGATLTAFRTALCTSLGLVKTFPVDEKYARKDTLIVYGVGDQAVWHVRLALILYPTRFAQVVCVNRTVEKAVEFCSCMEKGHSAETTFVPLKLGDPSLGDYFATASVVFTCVPSTMPTVTLDLVSKCEGRLFVGAIGSYKPQMIEVAGDVLAKALSSGGKILVDSKDHCLHEAGEFIQNGVGAESLLDYAAVYSGRENSDFLQTAPLVVSKIVGLCIMDVWVGDHCRKQAIREGTGVTIEHF